MRRRDIPVSTDCDSHEVDELHRLWLELKGDLRFRRAHAALGRLLTTKAEDLWTAQTSG